ncbi:MAG: hypothetical protein JWM52_84 [Candidatus Saccharibacteria bacterium]|nr:hypothetical protein [Candidatus Saccharibacteria bacterium]
MQSVSYTRPREKLQQKGPTVLSNAELLQILIGSGNAQASVARIAKRSLKQLTKYGTHISFDQLQKVDGLGPARACQIIAAFELASRYPMSQNSPIIHTDESLLELVSTLSGEKEVQLAYITLDGANRLISKRVLPLDEGGDPSSVLRKIFTDVLLDKATTVQIVFGSRKRDLALSMFERGLVHDLRHMAQVLEVKIGKVVSINESSVRTIGPHD